MLRYSKIGVDEVYSVERRNRIIAETAAPACRPVGARFERERATPVAARLDRPRFFWPKTARTLRVMDASDLVPGATAGSTVAIASVAPYTFVVPFPGVLRRIVCRDVIDFDVNNVSPNASQLRIRVRLLTNAGGLVTEIMDGLTSEIVPFDVFNQETEIPSGGTHKIEVACIGAVSGTVESLILNVRFEFALDITTPGV